MTRLEPEAKTPKNKLLRAILFIIILIVLVTVANAFMEDKPAEKAAVAEADAAVVVMAWTELDKQIDAMPSTKRDRLTVTITLDEPQSGATQKMLADTAKAVAVKYQQDSGLPIINVNLICQRAANEWGENQLAFVTYIPDGKGFNGNQNSGQWPTVRAAERGFTDQELEYLRLWAEMRGEYQKEGMTDEDALDAAISEKLGVEPGTVEPYLNMLTTVSQ